MHRWINDEVEIDFEIPKSLFNVIDELERCDREEDYGYWDWADALDVGAKEYVRQGKLTEKQWATLCRKYDGVIDNDERKNL